jgi:3-hydroxyisobutyrate dehydrogenase-like beta-hydroxyacid dehydrogenase
VDAARAVGVGNVAFLCDLVDVEVVATILPDTSDVGQVLIGEDGVFAHPRNGALFAAVGKTVIHVGPWAWR